MVNGQFRKVCFYYNDKNCPAFYMHLIAGEAEAPVIFSILYRCFNILY